MKQNEGPVTEYLIKHFRFRSSTAEVQMRGMTFLRILMVKPYLNLGFPTFSPLLFPIYCTVFLKVFRAQLWKSPQI